MVFVLYCLRPWLSHQSWPPICIYRPWPPICIYSCCPTICFYLPWPQTCIYRPQSKILLPIQGLSFVYTNFVYLIYVYIYRSGLRFVLPVWGMNLHSPFIGSGSSSGSFNSSSNNFFEIDNTNICMPTLVNQGKQTEVCTHTGYLVDVGQNQMKIFLASIRLSRSKG